MSVTGFSHYTVRSTRFDEALDFYRDILGLIVDDRPLPPGFPRAAIGSFPNGAWCVHHVSLRAVGYVATRARLEARGVTFREFTVGDRHLVQFLDLDGLEIELTFSPSELPNGPIPWRRD